MTRKKLLIPPKNPLHGICHSSAAIKATKVLNVPFEREWAHQSLKYLVLAIDEVEVQF